MDFGDVSTWLLIPLQILLVDLLLGADNALVIALACRSLPPEDMTRAATLGVAAAILVRLLMTTLAASLLTIPFLQIVGALALILIAMNISNDDALAGARPTREKYVVARFCPLLLNSFLAKPSLRILGISLAWRPSS